MITPQEIETLALKIAEPDFVVSHASLDPLIGHLDVADFDAVLHRAAEIARESGKALDTEADTVDPLIVEAVVDAIAENEEILVDLENLVRLGNAAGCPDDAAIIPWLLERGLVEKVDGGFRLKPAKPGPVTDDDE